MERIWKWLWPKQGAEENHGKPVRIAHVIDKILTKHLPHTSLELYHETTCLVMGTITFSNLKILVSISFSQGGI
jgi:hypothetical protein